MANDPTQQTLYSLICQNDSSRDGSFCVFQQDPNLGVDSAMSVAWLVEYVHPTTRTTFQWQHTFDFVWSQTGKLGPGIQVTSAQVWPADLSLTNQVTLTYLNGAFTFENQTQGTHAGSLQILQDQTIPADQASVGIGMSEAATFVVQSQPNLPLLFTPNPQYWITFGDYSAGQVLDPATIPDTQKKQVDYGVNVYSMTAILNADNTWTIQPTSQVNAAFLAAREEDPSARWGATPLTLPNTRSEP